MHDHVALHFALKSSKNVYCLFIFDTAILNELTDKAKSLAAAIPHLPNFNLEGCWNALKGEVKTGCGKNTAKAAIKTIMKRTISSGRAVSVGDAAELAIAGFATRNHRIGNFG